MMCSRIAIAAIAVGLSLATTGIVITPSAPAKAQRIGDEEQLRRAGELAEPATKRFDELMREARTSGEAQAGTPGAPIRMAQATPPSGGPTTGTSAAPAAKPDDDDILAPVWNWLERANRQYQGVIVKQLSEGSPATSLAMPQPVTPATPPVAAAPKATTPSTAVGQTPAPQPKVAQVPAQPTPAQPSVTPAAPPVKAPTTTTAIAPPAAAEKDVFDTAQEAVSDWLDRANRQYQSVIVRRLADPSPPESAVAFTKVPPPATSPATVAQQPSSTPSVPTKAVEDAARQADQIRREAEAKRLAELEVQRTADVKAKADAAAAQKAEADRRAAEAKLKADEERRIAEAKAKAEEETRRTAAAKAKAEEDSRRVAEAKAKADDEARRAAEARTKAEEERKQAEARAKTETERKVAAAAAAATAAAKAEADRRAAVAKADEDARRAAESQRVADAAAAKAETERQAAAARAAQTKQEADRRLAEQKRIADAKIEADRKAAADAAKKTADAAKSVQPPAKVATATPDSRPATATNRITVQRTVRPSSRYASTSKTKRRVASQGTSRSGLGAGSLRFAKLNSRQVPRQLCRQIAGVRVKPGNWYVVKRGDTLWHIAEMHYGDGKQYRLLQQANQRALSVSREINPCQRIAVPRMRAST